MGSVDICGKKMREWNEKWKVEQQQKNVRILVKALNTASLRQSAVRLQISCNLDLCLFSLSNLCVYKLTYYKFTDIESLFLKAQPVSE